jgi:pimeloyl-ACP methyl ester carboxylesterase
MDPEPPSPLGYDRPMQNRRNVSLAIALLLGGLMGATAWGLRTRPLVALPADPVELVPDAEAWVATRVAEGERLGVWPQATERLVRRHPGRAPVALLYIHGFGASRAEGEAVVDALATRWDANTLYLRLPGHGIDAEAHAATRPGDYAAAVSDALGVMPALGEKIVLIGGSTGGLLATWAAATHPEHVDALVLASPFYAFVDPLAQNLLPRVMAIHLLHAMYGEDRWAGWSEDPEGRKQEGYEDHWLIDQKYQALIALEDTRRAIARRAVYQRVEVPVLLLHHFRDEANQDGVVSVPAMRAAFTEMNGGSPHPQSRLVPIEDGNHILMSRYVRTDKDAVMSACAEFMATAIGPEVGGAAAGRSPSDAAPSPPGQGPG